MKLYQTTSNNLRPTYHTKEGYEDIMNMYCWLYFKYRLSSSEMLRRAAWYMFIDVSEELAVSILFCLLFVWLTLRPWRCIQYVPPKQLITSTRFHSVTSQNTVLSQSPWKMKVSKVTIFLYDMHLKNIKIMHSSMWCTICSFIIFIIDRIYYFLQGSMFCWLPTSTRTVVLLLIASVRNKTTKLVPYPYFH
jgi:hypothetical protein